MKFSMLQFKPFFLEGKNGMTKRYWPFWTILIHNSYQFYHTMTQYSLWNIKLNGYFTFTCKLSIMLSARFVTTNYTRDFMTIFILDIGRWWIPIRALGHCRCWLRRKRWQQIWLWRLRALMRGCCCVVCWYTWKHHGWSWGHIAQVWDQIWW